MGAATEKKSKACLPCRQLKKKCDGSRPCASCWNRGNGEACRDDDKVASCSMCRSRRLKCDRQRPCSRCVKSGNAKACTSRDGDWLVRAFDAGDSLMSPAPSAGEVTWSRAAPAKASRWRPGIHARLHATLVVAASRRQARSYHLFL